MMNKEILFSDLCKEVQKCTICKNVMFSPHFEESNCFVHVENKEQEECVNLWNCWQGSLNAKIMVIGQDYGVSTGEFITDKALVSLFEASFGIDITKRDKRLFFTNIANCYRKNKSTGSLNKGCLALCSNKYIGRLIRIISPKIIIVLGQETFNALAFCDNAKLVCENPVKENEKDSFADIINHKYKLMFNDGYAISVFPVYHPGALGQRNRRPDLQLEDWRKISNFYEEINMNKKKEDKHLVYHHNMFGPSCEVASLNNEEDFKIYCHLEHKICKPTKCNSCSYFFGDEDGKGKCCVWEETYDSVSDEHHPVQWDEVYFEFQRVENPEMYKDMMRMIEDGDLDLCNVWLDLD